MKLKTTEIAAWPLDHSSAKKRAMIKHARALLDAQANGGPKAPRRLDVPDAWAQPGRRAPGNGPKPLAGPDDPTIAREITMPTSYWDKAKDLGGTYSAGIRHALDQTQPPMSLPVPPQDPPTKPSP